MESNATKMCAQPVSTFHPPPVQAADPRCREMIRDLACYAAKALQGSFGELAVSWQ